MLTLAISNLSCALESYISSLQNTSIFASGLQVPQPHFILKKNRKLQLNGPNPWVNTWKILTTNIAPRSFCLCNVAHQNHFTHSLNLHEVTLIRLTCSFAWPPLSSSLHPLTGNAVDIKIRTLGETLFWMLLFDPLSSFFLPLLLLIHLLLPCVCIPSFLFPLLSQNFQVFLFPLLSFVKSSFVHACLLYTTSCCTVE